MATNLPKYIIDHVLRGIGILDARVKLWRPKIEISKIDVKSDTLSALGQVYGNHLDGLKKLRIDYWHADEFGFDPYYVGCAPDGVYWHRLGESWIYVLKNR